MSGIKPDSRELFRRIAKLSSEAVWTPEETREALTEAGLQREDTAETIVNLVTRLKKESPFHWKNRASEMRRELLDKAKATVKADTAGLTRLQLLDRLKEAIGRLPASTAGQYAVAFRKFDQATDDDLRSMLEEVAILQSLEKDQH